MRARGGASSGQHVAAYDTRVLEIRGPANLAGAWSAQPVPVHLPPFRRAHRARPFCGDRPPTRACRACVPHGSVGSMRAPGARSACTSLIFVRCASPPGTACATLLCPARAPRGSTRGPRGAGDPRTDPGGAPACARRPRPRMVGCLYPFKKGCSGIQKITGSGTRTPVRLAGGVVPQ